MRVTDEELKQLYQERITGRLPADECLGEDLVIRAAAKDLGRAERARVVDHLRACSDCARSYRIAHAAKEWTESTASLVLQEGATAGPARPLSTSGGWWRLMQPKWKALSVSAVIVVAIGISLLVWRANQLLQNGPGSQRGGGDLTIAVDPPEGSVLTDVPRQFRWSAVEPAEAYQVIVYDFELTPIWESPQLEGTSVELPEVVRQKLSPGAAAYWRVVVTTGIERRQSQLFKFDLAR